MHKLTDQELIGLLVEETGQSHDSNPVKMILASLKHLKAFADFKSPMEAAPTIAESDPQHTPNLGLRQEQSVPAQNIGLNLGYTINLNLPATSDPEVFDAIFKSLKQHLLRAEDG